MHGCQENIKKNILERYCGLKLSKIHLISKGENNRLCCYTPVLTLLPDTFIKDILQERKVIVNC